MKSAPQPLASAAHTQNETLAAPRESDCLLLSAKEAARLCGIGERTWWTRNAAGAVPAPVRLGGATRWRRNEIEAWIEDGCPRRDEWEAWRDASGRKSR